MIRRLRSLQKIALWAMALVVAVVACAAGERGDRPSKASPSSLETPYERERAALPEPVHALFYAVKDSLDYASVTGGSDGQAVDVANDPLPAESLEDYERVTKDLLERFNRDFRIERYAVDGWDYELVVARKDHANEKYKATRRKMFRLKDARWESLGTYLHW